MSKKGIITLMILFAALTGFSTISFAQKYPGDRAGKESDMLYKKLNLTDDQYSKVYSSLLSYYTKQDVNMKEYKNDMKACEEACKKDWESVKSSMSSILNKDQMAIYSKMDDKSMMRASMKKHHKKMTKSTGSEKTEMNKDEAKKKDDSKKKTEDSKKSSEKK